MKITYPECQIEISAEEVIALIDHANLIDAGTQLVQEIEDYKEKLREELSPADLEQVTGQVKKGSRPMTIEEMAEEISNPQGMIGPDFDPMFPTVKVPKVVGLDEDPELDPEPKPKQKSTRLKKPKKKMKLADIPFRMGRDGQTPEQKPTPKKDSGKKKKVDVRLDNGDWFTFDSVSAAADSIGGSSNGLSTALKNGAKFHGHEVRWSNPELDACLAEIEKSDKTPYQPSQRP